MALILYGAHEVGYRKDIVQWHDDESLQSGLRARVENIISERLRIADQPEAEAYFNSAALRKEAVFVSYSGRDEAIATPLQREGKISAGLRLPRQSGIHTARQPLDRTRL